MATEGFRDQLHKLFKRINELSGDVFRLKDGVVTELLWDDECIDRLRRAAIGTSLLGVLVKAVWDERFESALHGGRLDPPRDAVLCGFGQVRDRALTGAGIDAFITRLGKEPGFDVRAAVLASESKDVEDTVSSIEEVVGALIRFRDPDVRTENKTRVVDAGLLKILREAYDEMENEEDDYAYSSLGGVPAIMADALAQLGMPNVAVLTPYHANSMTPLYQGRPSRLDMETLSTDPIGDGLKVSYRFLQQEREHPVRCSYIAAYDDGHVLTVGGRQFPAGKADRAIFRVVNYVADHRRQWNHIHVKVPVEFDLTHESDKAWRSLRTDEWQFFGFFHYWAVNQRCLTIHVLGRRAVEEIGRRYTYVLLNAPRMDGLGEVPQQDVRILLKQLRWLAGVGARLHLEVSGVDSPEKINIACIRDALGGTVRSMGINDKELLRLARARRFGEVPIPPIQPYLLAHGSEITRRYQAALHLCYELDLDRLYVHANDLDLILRRDAQPADLRNELRADLLAKWVVVLAAIQRRNHDWESYLDEAYDPSSGGDVRHPLSPHLLAKGFKLLIELFTDLASIHPSLRDAKAPSVEEQLMRGYWLNRNPGGYSVVGVPVMWPDLPIEVNTTGAGDLCSGISAVYAGF